jgi:hypothetical protein
VLSGDFLDDFDNQLQFSRGANDMNCYSQLLLALASLPLPLCISPLMDKGDDPVRGSHEAVQRRH